MGDDPPVEPAVPALSRPSREWPTSPERAQLDAARSLESRGMQVEFAQAAAQARQLLSRQSGREKQPARIESKGESEDRCRYCFGGSDEGELIAPCRCDGGQKWVHVECLRKWQRTVMLQQPTHPSCYEEDDRYLVCHVCTAPFACAPPPRHELMASLAGETLSTMLAVGSLICAEPATSDEMEEAVSVHPALAPQLVHWIRGVFLVTAIDTGDDGDDVITAVNLARPIHESVLPEDLQEEFAKQSLYFGPTPTVDLRHGVGGPVAMSHCTALLSVPADFDPKPLPLHKVLTGGEDGEVVLAGELKDVAKLVRTHPKHLAKPVRVLWGFGRWSRAQLLGELAQQEWGMCPGLSGDLDTEALHLWEQVWGGRTVVAPPNEMSCPRETPRDIATPNAETASAMAAHRALLREQVLARAHEAEARGEW